MRADTGFGYTFVEKQLKHRPVKLNRYQSDKLNCCSWPAHVQQSGGMGPAEHAQLKQARAVSSAWDRTNQWPTCGKERTKLLLCIYSYSVHGR